MGTQQGYRVPGAGDFTSVGEGGVLVLSICFLLKAFFLLKDSEGYSIAQWIDMVWIQRRP